MTTDTQRLAARVNSSIGRSSDSWVWRPLLGLLAGGRPITVEDLAEATGRPAEQVGAAVAALPDTEYDRAGKIVGHGITLVPTSHRFEVDGHQLYTWCALDTLLFPIILGRPARITSPCRATGTLIQIDAEPDKVTAVDPAAAVVSIVTPGAPASIRAAFCNQVHFFATTEVAQGWLDQHPGATLLPVADAFTLSQAIVGEDAKPGC